MKLLVLGHYSWDVVHHADGTEERERGGLHRAVEFLATVASRQDRIVPLFGVHTSELQELLQLLKRFPNMDSSGVFPMETPTHTVQYFPARNGVETSCVAEMAPPIPFERVRKFLDADGILINMVSGADIRLETLDEIRMAVRGSPTKIHFDYHNLTLGIGERSRRFRRPVPDWRRWAFMVDTLQLNEEELAGLTTERLIEDQVVGHLLTLSTKGVLVTRGSAGVTAYTSEHKRVVRKDIGVPENAPGPAGGRGDLFGAAFVFRYCDTGDVVASAEYAAARASEVGTE